MNIVIPFRNTCGEAELQMCVKLINKNMKSLFSTIYIVGDNISFQEENVVNLPVITQKYSKWLDSSFLVDYYIKNCNDGDPFMLFNDDFFITEKLSDNYLCNYYSKDLSHRILTTYVIEPKTNVRRLSTYGMNISHFITHFGDYKNYEVHIPMIIEYPSVMRKAIEITKECDCPALKRTYYMYLLEEYGLQQSIKIQELPHDIKYGEPLRIMQYPFFSLTDTEFKAFEKDFKDILQSE